MRGSTRQHHVKVLLVFREQLAHVGACSWRASCSRAPGRRAPQVDKEARCAMRAQTAPCRSASACGHCVSTQGCFPHRRLALMCPQAARQEEKTTEDTAGRLHRCGSFRLRVSPLSSTVVRIPLTSLRCCEKKTGQNCVVSSTTPLSDESCCPSFVDGARPPSLSAATGPASRSVSAFFGCTCKTSMRAKRRLHMLRFLRSRHWRWFGGVVVQVQLTAVHKNH